MQLPAAAMRHLASDRVAWLTTVTRAGVPVPTPVWFVAQPYEAGEQIVVFCEPIARRLENIAANPNVSLHFNSDPDGGDVVVVRCTAKVLPDGSMADQPGYLDKYPDAAEYVPTSTTRIVLTPVGVWLGPD
jgi:PPOX class probable F420-dependent enzyme